MAIYSGTPGNDSITGSRDNDYLIGLAGDDTLDGSWGYDTLDGGSGTDTANYSLGWGGIKANLQTGVVSFFNDRGGGIGRWSPGGTGRLISIENLVGSGGNDEIVGSSANNVLSGGDGNDTLVGGVGNDTLLGGNGDDRLIDTDGSVDGGAGTDTLVADYSQLNNGAGVDVGYNGYNAIFTRLDGNSILSYSNIEQFNITGTQYADVLRGGAGNDSLSGGGGNDELYGGGGNDTVVGGDGNDIVEGGDGNDILSGGNSDNSYSAFDGNDSLSGGSGNDTLFGGYGDDTLNGGSGSNNLMGGPGNDVAQVVDDTDMVLSLGGDRVSHGANTDYLSNIEQVQLIGGDSNNRLSATQAGIAVKLEGRGGNDYLEGGRLDDTLEGGAGDDTLVGGMGTNHLYGGAGKDVFTLYNYDPGMQIVHDFERTSDRFDMQGVNLRDIRVTREGNDSLIWVNNTTFGAGGPVVSEAPRFRVLNAQVDSRDFTNVGGSGSFEHLPLSADAQTNVGTLIRQWATAYGTHIGKAFLDNPITGGTDPLLSDLQFTQKNIQYLPIHSPEQEFVALGSATVKATAGGSVTFQGAYERHDSTATAVTDQHSVGFSMGRTISVEAQPLGIGVGGDTSFTMSYDFTRAKTTTTEQGVSRNISVSSAYDLLPYSVTTVEGGIVQERVDVNFSADLAVDGNVKLSFANNSTVEVPIDAILQTYMPSVFRGQGAVKETTLSDGTYLVYNEDTVFTQAGTINKVVNIKGDAHPTKQVQDDELTAPSLGTHRGEAHAERFWVARGSIPDRGNSTLELENFHVANDGFMDKIGIDVNNISRFEQLTLSTKTITVEIPHLGAPSSFEPVASTHVSYGNQSLVDIVGVTPDQLNSSHFVFSTAGTYFDRSIGLANAGSTQTL